VWHPLAVRLQVCLLGPLEVTVDGKPVRLTGRLRTLLLALAVSAGRTVSFDRLVEAMWGQELPVNPKASVRTYVTRLRALLGAEAIGTRPEGYVLNAGPQEIDALRFAELLDASNFDDALGLWRGRPFEGSGSAWLEDVEAPRLVERYLSALERRIDRDVAEGRLDRLVAELTELTSRHPLRESLWARLLVVLDRCGRTAEALERYQLIRERIADELGADPGPELQALNAELLSRRPSGTARPTPDVVPRQLPGPVAGFVGREKALGALDAFAGEAMPPVVITAIGGAAGIGKTALAVHWAHRVADRFADGQLFANMRGFDPSGSPRHPAEVLRGFVVALGIPPTQTPSDVDDLVGVYRSLLAGKRMLILLDNARDAEQIRPLLPATPGCLAVVTSRDRMAGLIATEGAVPVVLEAMSAAEARQLLDRRLGAQRVDSDPAAIERIVERCASLPLALAVVAARAALRMDFPLSALAAELGGLDAFAGTDPASDVRAVFSWSYRTLGVAAARLFRLLGLHPGPDIGIAAVASLAGINSTDTGRLLSELVAVHLITEHTPGRYTFHDLLRAYAAEQAHARDPDIDRRAATERMLDHYVHSGHCAAMLIYPQREPIALNRTSPGVRPESFADHHAAMGWFAAEIPVLLGVVATAAAEGFDASAWPMAWALVDALDRHGRWRDIIATQTLAIEAAQRLGEQTPAAQAHRDIARAFGILGRHTDAHRHLGAALDISTRLGDAVGQANTHRNIARILEFQGRLSEAIEHCHQAMALYRRIDDRVGRARTYNSLGWFHGLLDRHEQALEFCEQALRLHREVGNALGQATTLDSLGVAHLNLGREQEAIACFREAVTFVRDIGDLGVEAEVLTHLGDAHLAAGDPDVAGAEWRRALRILSDLGHPDADQIKAKLQSLTNK